MSEAGMEFPATLDLSSADTAGNKMDNGWKDAVIFEVKPIVTTNPEGALAVGTPGLNVQFKVEGGKFDNRRVFNKYWMPSAEQQPDNEKRDRSLGMLARFLEAAGFEDVKSPSFNIAEAIAKMNTEHPAVQVNTRYDEEWDNSKVTGVKARSGVNAGTGAGVL